MSEITPPEDPDSAAEGLFGGLLKFDLFQERNCGRLKREKHCLACRQGNDRAGRRQLFEDRDQAGEPQAPAAYGSGAIGAGRRHHPGRLIPGFDEWHCLLRDEPRVSGGDAATGSADQQLRGIEIRPTLTHQRENRLGEGIRRIPRDPQNSNKELNEFVIAPTELVKTSPTSPARSSSSRRS
jgi:hypothetical protein